MNPVIRLATPRPAPATPATGTAPDPIVLFAEAQNALAMALRHLRNPGALNVPGARRKAVQALAALRRLQALEQGGAA